MKLIQPFEFFVGEIDTPEMRFTIDLALEALTDDQARPYSQMDSAREDVIDELEAEYSRQSGIPA